MKRDGQSLLGDVAVPAVLRHTTYNILHTT